jgi:hypothetical protein
VPRWTAQYYAFALREPLLLGIPIGMYFAWRYRRREVLLPLAVVVAMTAVFAIGPIFGLPLIGRYLRTPSIFLALFYGLAVFGWMLLPRESRERRGWLVVGVIAALLSVVYVPTRHVELLSALHTRSDREGKLYSDLRAAAQSPVVRSAIKRCAPLTAGDHRPVPYTRWWIDGDPGSVGTVEGGRRVGGLLLEPRRTFIPRWFYTVNLKLASPLPPAGYRRLYENRSWRIYARAGCS